MSAEHMAGRPVSDSTYSNPGCRCEGCTEAHRVASAERRARQTGRRPAIYGQVQRALDLGVTPLHIRIIFGLSPARWQRIQSALQRP